MSSSSEHDSDGESSHAEEPGTAVAAPAAAQTSHSVISEQTFESLGVAEQLCKAAAAIGWTKASTIQAEALPAALEGRDVIGLAETGSGKTGAFSIPILQALLSNPQRLFAVVLAPTRELAFQIHEVFEGLGQHVGAKSVCIVGGVDMMSQAIALARKPHIIVATPGRLVDHLENTKGFNLRNLKYLVMDEADRMLSMDFEEELNKILDVIPDSSEGRRTMLFSATMTSKVEKLQRASLSNPLRVEVSTKFQTPKNLLQQYLFVPAKYKDTYLTYLLNEASGQSVLVFAATCNNAQRITLMLRNLGFPAVCLHGQMSQPKRLGALTKFKAGTKSILICTDVAARGLDIPSVDAVINYDLPGHGKDYIHRVGRTARAGRSGKAYAIVTQYDVEVYQRLEALLGTKLPSYDVEESTVLLFLERVSEAQRLATRELKELLAAGGDKDVRGKKRKGGGDESGDAMRQEARDGYKGGSGGKGGGYKNQRGAGDAQKKFKQTPYQKNGSSKRR
jgi:ATP-dependent RNA helicase DDX47/RRP3